jgi:Rieske Fe-S protein
VKRRELLGALPAGALLGCQRQAPDRRLRVEARELAARRRVVVEYRGEPVEVFRAGEEAVARSLVCTHYGCRVEWREDRRRYECPCHLGTYDEAGQPIAGPPVRPLRLLPVAIEGDAVLVGER